MTCKDCIHREVCYLRENVPSESYADKCGYSHFEKDLERPQGDLISRNNLREDLRRFFPTDIIEGIDPKTLFAQIMHDIDNAQPVEPEITEYDLHCAMTTGYKDGYEMAKAKYERPKGEWVKCGCDLTCNRCGWKVLRKYKFCICGADMRGDEE